jgi:ribose transport system substrate-binding protein
MGGDRWKVRATARAALVMAALGAAGVAAGCGSSDDGGGGGASTAASAGGGSLEGKTVQFLSCVDTNTFCGTTNRYVSERLGEKGVKVTVQQANFDPVQQALQFDQAIAARPDLIMIQVADPNAIVPSLRKARAAGIPVVNTIGRLNEDSYELLAASVECDCDALGRQAAQNIVRGLRELGLRSGNVVAITGSRAQNISADRIRAFEDELAKTPEYRLVAVEDGNWGDGPSADLYRQLAAKYAPQGGIQAVWGMADNQTNAIIQAAKQNGERVGARARGLIAVGTSCQPISIRNLKSGDQYAGSTNSPITEAKPLVDVAERLLAGEQVDPITRAEESIVTAENIDQFAEECDFGA